MDRKRGKKTKNKKVRKKRKEVGGEKEIEK
jgi:hypothetical protein